MAAASFPSFSLFSPYSLIDRASSNRSPNARHDFEADIFVSAEWSERLTPGRLGWIGAAAVGSIPLLIFLIVKKVKNLLLFLEHQKILAVYTLNENKGE